MQCKSDSPVNISGDKIKEAIELISNDTDKVELLEMLDPVFHELATMNDARIEAYLRHVIKPRFDLTEREIDGYRRVVEGYRDGDSSGSERVSERPGRNVNYKDSFDGLVDLVEHDGRTAFLIKDGDGLLVETKVLLDGREYLPPPRDQIPWLLCQGEEVVKRFNACRSTADGKLNADLYDDLRVRFTEISELPGEEYYDLLTAWVFHTYLTETVEYTPIICFHSVPERGKSRTGKGMIYVAHRGLLTESLREANILRAARDLKASIVFDIRDIWKKAEREGSDDILLGRFEKGFRIARVLYPERGPHLDMVWYPVFGPTVIATNQAVHKILDTRAITINMPIAQKSYENDVKPEDALPLKARLAVFRARQMGRLLPEVQKPAKSRLGDILRPIAQIIEVVRPERKEAFMQLVTKLVERREIEKADSLEAKIVSTIVSLESRVTRGILPVQTITDTVNEGKLDRFKLSPQRIGRVLSALGFQKGTTGSGASAIVLDEEFLRRAMESYNIPQTSETSETSEI